MSLILPYPGKPANGDTLDASIVQANITAIAQAIQSFDASQVSPGTLTAAAFAASINPNTLLKETITPFVASGCIWSIVSGLQGTMSAGVIYVNGIRVSVGGVGSYNFTASQDTYIDIDYNGNLYYQAVANGATSPTLTANSVRVAMVTTNATGISTITQSGLDNVTTSGQLNFIYNTNPNASPVYVYTNSGSAGGTFYYTQKAGAKRLWGQTAAHATGSTAYLLSFPSGLFAQQPVVTATLIAASSATQYVSMTSPTTSGVNLYFNGSAGNPSAQIIAEGV